MMFGLVGFFNGCANTFALRRLTNQQVVVRGEVGELRRRFESWLSPNALSFGVPLFNSAISALTIKNFDKICPIVCLFLTYGVDPKMKLKNGSGSPILTGLAYPPAYNRRLAWLAATCGADYGRWKNAYAKESQGQVRGERGKVYRLRQEGDRLYDQNYYADAVFKYQEALILLERFCEEEHSLLEDQSERTAIDPIDRSHPAIVETYEALITKLSARLNETCDLRDGDTSGLKCA